MFEKNKEVLDPKSQAAYYHAIEQKGLPDQSNAMKSKSQK